MPTKTTHKPFQVPRAHLPYWPYACDQTRKLHILLERFYAWRGFVDELHDFFTGIKHLEHLSSKHYQSAAFQWEAKRTSTSIAQLTTPFQQYANLLAGEHVAFGEYIDSVIKKTSALKSEIDKKTKLYKSAFKKSHKSLTITRTKALSSISAHQSITKNRMNSKDPWLAERVLDFHLRKMISEENVFEATIAGVIDDMNIFDKTILTNLQKLWIEYTSERDKHTPASRSKECLEPFMNHCVSESFDTYLSQNFIMTTAVVRSLEEFSYTVHNPIRVLKEGLVYRQGVFRKSAWKECVIVLTESGWVHCFDIPKSSTKPFFMKLFNSGGKEETNYENIYNSLEKPHTRWSLPLRHPRVSCEFHTPVSGATTTKNVFELRVQEYEMNILNTGGSVKKVLIKTKDEEALVEWVFVLRQKLAVCLEKAPRPIYSIREQMESEEVVQNDEVREEEEEPEHTPYIGLVKQKDSGLDMLGHFNQHLLYPNHYNEETSEVHHSELEDVTLD